MERGIHSPFDWTQKNHRPSNQGDGGKLRLLKKRSFELGNQGVQAEAFGGDVLAFKNPAGPWVRASSLGARFVTRESFERRAV